MLGYIVLNYDLKLPGDGSRPPNVYWSEAVIAAPTAEVMFRKRKV